MAEVIRRLLPLVYHKQSRQMKPVMLQNHQSPIAISNFSISRCKLNKLQCRIPNGLQSNHYFHSHCPSNFKPKPSSSPQVAHSRDPNTIDSLFQNQYLVTAYSYLSSRRKSNSRICTASSPHPFSNASTAASNLALL